MQYFIAIRVINNMRTECLVVGRWRIQSISSPLPSSHIINHTLPTILKMIYNHCTLQFECCGSSWWWHDYRSLCFRGVNNKHTYAGMLTAMLQCPSYRNTNYGQMGRTYLSYQYICNNLWSDLMMALLGRSLLHVNNKHTIRWDDYYNVVQCPGYRNTNYCLMGRTYLYQYIYATTCSRHVT